MQRAQPDRPVPHSGVHSTQSRPDGSSPTLAQRHNVSRQQVLLALPNNMGFFQPILVSHPIVVGPNQQCGVRVTRLQSLTRLWQKSKQVTMRNALAVTETNLQQVCLDSNIHWPH